jgi:hypothetical protein
VSPITAYGWTLDVDMVPRVECRACDVTFTPGEGGSTIVEPRQPFVRDGKHFVGFFVAACPRCGRVP